MRKITKIKNIVLILLLVINLTIDGFPILADEVSPNIPPIEEPTNEPLDNSTDEPINESIDEILSDTPIEDIGLEDETQEDLEQDINQEIVPEENGENEEAVIENNSIDDQNNNDPDGVVITGDAEGQADVENGVNANIVETDQDDPEPLDNLENEENGTSSLGNE